MTHVVTELSMNGTKEYRLSKITSYQGHYLYYKNLDQALKSAKKWANDFDEPVIIQLWKPKRGKKIYIVKHKSFPLKSKEAIIKYYKDDGYDVKYIKSSKYILKK